MKNMSKSFRIDSFIFNKVFESVLVSLIKNKLNVRESTKTIEHEISITINYYKNPKPYVEISVVSSNSF